MDVEAIEKLPATESDKTTAGNYFVATYPPFSFWNSEDTGQVHNLLAEPAPADVPVNLSQRMPD